eukprot:CAMPEP_0206311476 /NCGR_PEP_ID=MMETSP0106_2-20121207/13481_1 /ASSEMBLY_ACC=CAM_ASM_000206 /TAXON_ID=81532 /ORGANISM="Acanthoeca-like sp., Strain 10tr" /LENGTH=81 /DNA_ID=CAMNT_0053742721 /DNA_START=670 /DNA_END=916 /DNA_ORIENTATION=+
MVLRQRFLAEVNEDNGSGGTDEPLKVVSCIGWHTAEPSESATDVATLVDAHCTTLTTSSTTQMSRTARKSLASDNAYNIAQ